MGETILGSRYEIIRKIGDGGMAFVYEAKDRLLNRIVAVNYAPFNRYNILNLC